MKRIYGKKHIGMTNKNSFGTIMKIVDYIDCNNIYVEFQDEYKYVKHASMKNFSRGSIANPYDKTVLGVGFIGHGVYSKENDTDCYTCWRNMLIRCFSKEYKEKYPTYKESFVDNEWLNFQNFAKWYYENIYYVPNERTELDKDILYKNNKIYSKDTCIFVPRRINSLLINNKSVRGKYPVGVDLYDGRFRARCNTPNWSVFIGNYDTAELAFEAYKKYKQHYIKQIADEYRNKIPNKLYNALYSYTIEKGD